MPIPDGAKNTELDLVIIGAGASGLAAAHEVERKKLSYVLLEAKPRAGGRTFTEAASLGVPFDHGAYWMHSASLNPYAKIADSLGFTYRKEAHQRRVFMGDRWATDREIQEREAFFERSLAAVMDAGRAGKDVPYSHVVEEGGPWRPLFDQWTAAVNGVDPDEASTLDHANYRDTGENWPVREGFGELVVRHASGIRVETDTPALRVRWGGPALRVETPKGTLSAKGVILTVSTGVLASGVIRFDPPLPEWKQSAIQAIPMGKANKVAFRFSRDVFDVPDDSSATLFAESSSTLGFQLRHFGQNLAIGYLGGRFCSEMEAAGPKAMEDFGLERLKSLFGSGIVKHLLGSISTAWESDPFIRGAYSAARPGSAHRRADLAVPVEDRLFFAGEAASREFFSTVHGAYFSGVEAAEAAARAIRPTASM